MAYSIPCIFCGFMESDHDPEIRNNGCANGTTKKDGYKKSLDECKRYEPEDKKMSDKIKAIESEEINRDRFRTFYD